MITIENILDAEKHLTFEEAVIFDLDDTLYSEKDYIKSGFDAISSAFADFPKIKEELWQAFSDKKNAIDFVFEKYGLLNKKEEALRLYRFNKPQIRLYSGVLEMIERIKRTKKVGIITDGRPEGQNAKIDALGIRDVFDEIIITDELGGIKYRKPNETAFLIMAERLNVSPNKMIYIGDNINKDGIAPEKTGAGFIYFKNKDGLY